MPLRYIDDGPPPDDHPINKGKQEKLPPIVHHGLPVKDYYEQDDVVETYDARREQAPKWIAEQQIIEVALECLPKGSIIYDAPCGTGRWFDVIRRCGHEYIGLDSSEKMLIATQAKTTKDDEVLLLHGAVQDRILKERSVDCSVMCRLTRWLGKDERKAALHELQRVTKDLIIFTARVRNNQFAFPYEEIDECVLPEWAPAWDYGAAEEDYRVLALARRTSPWFKNGEQIGLPVEAK